MATMATIKRRKPASKRKTAYLRARTTEAVEAEIKAAADRAGISLSAWMVDRLLKAARQEAKAE